MCRPAKASDSGVRGPSWPSWPRFRASLPLALVPPCRAPPPAPWRAPPPAPCRIPPLSAPCARFPLRLQFLFPFPFRFRSYFLSCFPFYFPFSYRSPFPFPSPIRFPSPSPSPSPSPFPFAFRIRSGLGLLPTLSRGFVLIRRHNCRIMTFVPRHPVRDGDRGQGRSDGEDAKTQGLRGQTDAQEEGHGAPTIHETQCRQTGNHCRRPGDHVGLWGGGVVGIPPSAQTG